MLETLNIANGVKLCVMPTDRFKTSIASIRMTLPLTGDISANAVLAYLLRRKCKKHPDMTLLNRRLEELYGASLKCSVSKLGEAQQIYFSISCVDNRFSLDSSNVLSECIELLLSIVFEPAMENGHFSESDIELEKRLMLERIDGEFSEKRLYAANRLIEEMCKNELFGQNRFGKAEDIKTINSSRLENAWKRLIHQSDILINVVGNIDIKTVEEKVADKFKNIDRSNLEKIHTEFISSAKEPKKIDEKLPIKQGKLVMGLRAGMKNHNDNKYSIRVMVDMLGGGPYSKFFTNVREKMSLCYYCSARLDTHKGIIMIQSGIEDENEEKATKAILQQLSDMQNGKVAGEELETSLKSLKDSIKSVEDTPEGIASWYLSQAPYEEFITPEKYSNLLGKVTLEEVIAAANGVTLDTIYMLSSDRKNAV